MPGRKPISSGPGTPSVLRAHPLQASLSVDGQLDEPEWQQAVAIDNFLQFEPDEGAPATQKTEVRVLYGANNVYFGVQLYDDEPQDIQRTLGQRDELNQADWFVVSIDSYFGKRTAFVFGVNAAGVQFDAIRTGASFGPGGGMDESWDAVWASGVSVNAQGWALEMRIPYSMLRFVDSEEQTWGIHFERRIPRRGEESQWPLVPRSERANLIAGYGLLQGLNGIKPRGNFPASSLYPHPPAFRREPRPAGTGTPAEQRRLRGGPEDGDRL